MNHDIIQQEITIMKNMIEKAKKDSAESGSLYLFMGIACIIYVLIVMIVEGLHLFSWSGLISWAGACIMAFTLNSKIPVRGITMIFILISGFIVPAIVLSRKYKNGSCDNES